MTKKEETCPHDVITAQPAFRRKKREPSADESELSLLHGWGEKFIIIISQEQQQHQQIGWRCSRVKAWPSTFFALA
jgi:hypothetical protein